MTEPLAKNAAGHLVTGTWAATRHGKRHRIRGDGGSQCGLVRANSNRWTAPAGEPVCTRCQQWEADEHGTSRCYRRGCRCQPCRAAASEEVRLRRWEARERRGGAPAGRAAVHGAHTYKNHHCRCNTCRAGHRAYTRDRRAARYAARVLTDGRLVTPGPVIHGRESTYSNHGCRCEPCTNASVEYKRHDYGRRAS